MAFVWAATMVPMAFNVAFSVLVLCRIILGAAEGPSIAIANHAVFKWFPDKKRALPSAIVSIGSSVGVLFSAPAIAWLIRTYDWNTALATRPPGRVPLVADLAVVRQGRSIGHHEWRRRLRPRPQRGKRSRRFCPC